MDLKANVTEINSVEELQTQIENYEARNLHVICECDLKDLKFNDFVDFEGSTFAENVSFNGTVFAKGVSFKNVTFKQDAKFKKTVFHGDVFFKKAKFKNGCRFIEAKFNNSNDIDMDLEDKEGRKYGSQKGTFRASEFYGSAVFNKVQFNRNIYWGLSKFENANFDNSVFKNDCNFSRVLFNGRASFNQTDFMEKVNFEHVMFLNYPALFMNTNLRKIILEGTFFDKPAQFRREKSKSKKFDICNNKLSYSVLKNEALNINDSIQAKELYSYEMNAYRNELKGTNLFERFALLLNKYSNWYGEKWQVGVLFTIIVSSLFFGLFLCFFDNNLTLLQFHNIVRYYVQFLYIGHDFDFMKDYSPYAGAYVVDLIGRIFISYGYYQTIAAFRKFKFS